LAAILSAVGEKKPQLALDVNVKSTIYAMNIANDNNCRLFIPSSIASFGGNRFQKINTPVDAI
jgi:nucleoside-diphosphate-sugar epimerase